MIARNNLATDKFKQFCEKLKSLHIAKIVSKQ